MTRALLVLAHGTPHPESNRALFDVVDRVRATRRFDLVETAFLDLNEPDIATAIDRLVSEGALEIVCVPHFLHAGRHVRHDIPAILDEATSRHPDVTISLGGHAGARPELKTALLDRMREALAESGGEVP